MQHGCACKFEKNALRHVNEFVFLSEPIKIQGGRCNTSSLSKERPDQLLVCERFLFGLTRHFLVIFHGYNCSLRLQTFSCYWSEDKA